MGNRQAQRTCQRRTPAFHKHLFPEGLIRLLSAPGNTRLLLQFRQVSGRLWMMWQWQKVPPGIGPIEDSAGAGSGCLKSTVDRLVSPYDEPDHYGLNASSFSAPTPA